MVTITLPSNLEKVVSEEAARKGTTAERLTLDVLQQRFLNESLAGESAEAVPSSLFQRVEELLNLKEGWNGYGAPPPNHWAVTMASSAMGALYRTLSVPDRIAPSAVGGVGTTFRRGKRKAYVECYNSGKIVLLLSDAEAEQLQTCKIEPVAEGLLNLPYVIKEYLEGGR